MTEEVHRECKTKYLLMNGVIQTRGQSKKDDPLDKLVLLCRQERNIYYRSGKKLQQLQGNYKNASEHDLGRCQKTTFSQKDFRAKARAPLEKRESYFA